MKEIFLQISNRQDLSQDQVQAVFDRILKNEVSESQIAAFLMGLKTKGETADEITGIVRALKSHATVLPETFTDAMCNCGTGGDQSYSFNISTTVCFVLAAGGIRMAKAGNRSISSKSGSADVLEALGINVSASPETRGWFGLYLCSNHASSYAFYRSSSPSSWDSNDYELGWATG